VHRAGFVNIIGRPNVGKSTLMNQLMGGKMSIVTPKPQTTRHRILGILNGEDYQVVFSDSPGIIFDPNYELQRSMNKFAYSNLEDADILVVMTDIFEKEVFSDSLIRSISESEIPLFLVINKTDLTSGRPVQEIENNWKKLIPFERVFHISALKAQHTDELLAQILKTLPESPPYFPKDQFSDRSERFFVSEIIREKILLLYKQEIPYSVEVEVVEFKESIKNGKDFVHIYAHIYVARRSQKPIIIGKQGASIKELGIESRKSIEEFLGKRIHLELFVKIREDWRDDTQSLKSFGYDT